MNIPDNPYLLLTPGPLSTTAGVRAALLRDWCTWDRDYNDLVQQLRADLVALATGEPGYVAVLMQGSGTFAVEATIQTAMPRDGKLLVLANGAYGLRMAAIAERAGVACHCLNLPESEPVTAERVREGLAACPEASHVAVVHCETTTGMLNPVEEVGPAVKAAGKVFLLDSMSGFAGIPLDQAALGADFLVSSANKCLQGVPGFGFVIAREAELTRCEGRARSLSLDLYDQWRVMEEGRGKWRFTSPTHVVRACIQAMAELREEGGVAARHARYAENQRRLVAGMRALGFVPFLPERLHSPIITSFRFPDADFRFMPFYEALKARGFVLYPGKVTGADTFRVGTIGNVRPEDVDRLLAAVAEVRAGA